MADALLLKSFPAPLASLFQPLLKIRWVCNTIKFDAHAAGKVSILTFSFPGEAGSA